MKTFAAVLGLILFSQTPAANARFGSVTRFDLAHSERAQLVLDLDELTWQIATVALDMIDTDSTFHCTRVDGVVGGVPYLYRLWESCQKTEAKLETIRKKYAAIMDQAPKFGLRVIPLGQLDQLQYARNSGPDNAKCNHKIAIAEASWRCLNKYGTGEKAVKDCEFISFDEGRSCVIDSLSSVPRDLAHEWREGLSGGEITRESRIDGMP